MPSDPEIEALRQRLDAFVKDTDAAKAKATTAHRGVEATRMLLEEEHTTTTDLERKAATAKGLLPSSSSSSTTSNMVDGAVYDSSLITNLQVQATVVQNVRQLMNIMLDTTSSNYTIWRDLMLMALTLYSLTDHVFSDDTFTNNPVWTRMDIVVLCWLTNTITVDL
jgi:hypothetical protein